MVEQKNNLFHICINSIIIIYFNMEVCVCISICNVCAYACVMYLVCIHLCTQPKYTRHATVYTAAGGALVDRWAVLVTQRIYTHINLQAVSECLTPISDKYK